MSQERSSVVLGLVLIGLALSAAMVFPVTSVAEVINTTFTVDAGTTYGPYDNETYYHTMIIGSSVLRGEVIIIGQGFYLTVRGEYTQHLKNIFVRDQFDFAINPAIDQYAFTFNNSDGVSSCLVRFVLEETWTRPVAFSSPATFIAWFGGLFLFIAGLVGLILKRVRERLVGELPSSGALILKQQLLKSIAIANPILEEWLHSEFSNPMKQVRHGNPGIGATESSAYVPLK
ncbi:MAG: hypothetical protein ACFFET_15195 [Candidatus Thorarchaeota archaeon]